MYQPRALNTRVPRQTLSASRISARVKDRDVEQIGAQSKSTLRGNGERLQFPGNPGAFLQDTRNEHSRSRLGKWGRDPRQRVRSLGKRNQSSVAATATFFTTGT